MTAARRLAAILAVDVVGYSRLMGEDEAGTARVHREATRPVTFNAIDRFPRTGAFSATAKVISDRQVTTHCGHSVSGSNSRKFIGRAPHCASAALIS